MPRMTGGEALAKSLYLEGVRVIFGLPGVQLYHALDGLAKEPGIRFITTRHEQATAYETGGLFDEMHELVKPMLSGISEWRMALNPAEGDDPAAEDLDVHGWQVVSSNEFATVSAG